jgi:hypothetical protein
MMCDYASTSSGTTIQGGFAAEPLLLLLLLEINKIEDASAYFDYQGWFGI